MFRSRNNRSREVSSLPRRPRRRRPPRCRLPCPLSRYPLPRRPPRLPPPPPHLPLLPRGRGSNPSAQTSRRARQGPVHVSREGSAKREQAPAARRSCRVRSLLLLRRGGGGRRGLALGRRLLLFLDLLDLLDLDHLHLRQAEGTAAVLPALLVLELQDALAAGQHVAGPLQAVLAPQAFINRHCDTFSFSVRPGPAPTQERRCPCT